MMFFEYIKKGWNSIVSLFFPDECLNCGSLLETNEVYLCDDCIKQLPRTEMHLHRFNQAESRLEGQARVERAAAYCWYVKDSQFRQMIHKGKYSNHPEVLYRLAQQAVNDWSDCDFFDDIDIIVPVPLHKKKLRQRGYNQSEYIAQALADKLNIPLCTDALIRIRNDQSQTQQVDKALRANNVAGAFELNKKYHWGGKTILLVDDVLTTGATIATCAKQFNKIRNTHIRVFTLAISQS